MGEDSHTKSETLLHCGNLWIYTKKQFTEDMLFLVDP